MSDNDRHTEGIDRCDLCDFFEGTVTDTVKNDETGEAMNVRLCSECHDKTLEYRHNKDVSFETELRLRKNNAAE